VMTLIDAGIDENGEKMRTFDLRITISWKQCEIGLRAILDTNSKFHIGTSFDDFARR